MSEMTFEHVVGGGQQTLVMLCCTLCPVQPRPKMTGLHKTFSRHGQSRNLLTGYLGDLVTCQLASVWGLAYMLGAVWALTLISGFKQQRRDFPTLSAVRARTATPVTARSRALEMPSLWQTWNRGQVCSRTGLWGPARSQIAAFSHVFIVCAVIERAEDVTNQLQQVWTLSKSFDSLRLKKKFIFIWIKQD